MKCCKENKTQSHKDPSVREARSKVKPTCTGACDACKERKAEILRKANLKIVLTSCLLLLTSKSYAQAYPSFWSDPFNHPLLPLYITMIFVGVTVLLLIAIVVYLSKVLGMINRQTELEKAMKSGKEYLPSPTWFERTWQKLNATVPLANEADIDLGHNFDGIRELDNHLPPWWKGLFYLTIIWAVVYLFVYHLTPVLPLQMEEYANELSSADQQARALAASRPAAVVDENTLIFINDDAIISKGKNVFVSNNCGSCHRQDGGGNNIGPNLTDNYWIHGGSIRDVFLTIKEGVVEKGMPAWGKVMSPEDVKSLAFYIMSLQGSNPVDPKNAQGELYVPEPPAQVADSMKIQTSLK